MNLTGATKASLTIGGCSRTPVNESDSEQRRLLSEVLQHALDSHRRCLANPGLDVAVDFSAQPAANKVSVDLIWAAHQRPHLASAVTAGELVDQLGDHPAMIGSVLLARLTIERFKTGQIDSRDVFQIGNDHPQNPLRLQNSATFAQHGLSRVGSQMFQDVRVINRVE